MKPSPVVFKKTGSAGPSPTQRTLTYLRKQGFYCGIVERRNPALKHVSHDLFGIIDIIALTPDGVMGVQSTGAAFSSHRTKLTLDRAADTVNWLRTPGTSLMLIGWRKLRDSWRPRIEMLAVADVRNALREVGREAEIKRLRL